MEASLTLTKQELEKFADIAYRETGIRISPQKLELMNNRLSRRLRELNLRSFRDYLEMLQRPGSNEMSNFVETITTNETYFFRCPRHFRLLSRQILNTFQSPTIDVWSAACSTGEEPYSLAIALLERMPNARNRKIRIFASDIDRKVLKKASDGVYGDYALRFVRPEFLKKYFIPLNNGMYQVIPELRQMVLFGQHNLQNPFPKGKVDLIFCRNVLIYFDDQSKDQVFRNLLGALRPNGYLFLGESEIVPPLSGVHRVEASVAQKKG